MSRVGAFLLGLVLISAMAGCYEVSHEFILAQKASADPVIIYKPDVGRGSNGIQIKIPWLELKGCPSPVEFSLSTGKWTLSHSFWTGTTAEFDSSAISMVAQEPEILALILNSIISSRKLETPCQLALSSDAPQVKPLSPDKIHALLAMHIVDRLPRSANMTLVDQYDYDARTQSLNITPGMRLRIDHVIPLTADNYGDDNSHPGVLASPVYLNLFGRKREDGNVDGYGKVLGNWSAMLSNIKKLEPNPRQDPDPDGRHWSSVSGVGDLIGKSKYWRVFYPKVLLSSTVSSKSVIEKFAKGDAESHFSAAVSLVGAIEKEDLVAFLKSALDAAPKVGWDFNDACKKLSNRQGKCFIFRYRAFVIPEISVDFNGKQEWVEVGTKVGDLIERMQHPHSGEQLERPSARLSINKVSDDYLEVARALSSWEAASNQRKLFIRRQWKGQVYEFRFDEKSQYSPLVLFDLELEIGDQVKWPR